LARIPRDQLAADVTVEDVLAEPSWDMSPQTMLRLARRARTAIEDDGFDGVVIAHGTDTLEETAFLADLMAGPAAGRGGIVLTGAMRYLDDPSTDGPANLASSIVAAADPLLRGVGAVVSVNGELHAARWVSKVDATSMAAFSSDPFPILGRVSGDRVESLATPPPRPPAAVGDPATDVALVKTYPGIDSALLSTIVDAGAQGIVLEGTGAGNVPVSLFTAINDLTRWDIPIVVASRCRTRPVSASLSDLLVPDLSVPDLSLPDLPVGVGLAAKVGAIGAGGLPASKAWVALMVALGAGGVTGVRDWFARLP
jgi:L-asparaginase